MAQKKRMNKASHRSNARNRRQGVMKAVRRQAGEVAENLEQAARKTGKKIQGYIG